MGVTDTQSYSLVIRDVFYDAVAGDAFFANYTKRKTPMLRLQPELLPYLAVYFMDEDMVPDGDANAGAIRFSHTLQIGFSVMLANNDQVNTELMLDAAYWRIMNRLWTDQYIMNLLDTTNPNTGASNPDNVRIEGITEGPPPVRVRRLRARQRNAGGRAAIHRVGVLPQHLVAGDHRRPGRDRSSHRRQGRRHPGRHGSAAAIPRQLSVRHFQAPPEKGESEMSTAPTPVRGQRMRQRMERLRAAIPPGIRVVPANDKMRRLHQASACRRLPRRGRCRVAE